MQPNSDILHYNNNKNSKGFCKESALALLNQLSQDLPGITSIRIASTGYRTGLYYMNLNQISDIPFFSDKK